MRLLLWITVGFATVCGLFAYFYVPFLPQIALGLAAICILLLLVTKWFKPVRILALILCGCVLGTVWFHIYDSIYLQKVRAVDEKILRTTVTAMDYSYETDYGMALDALADIDGQKVRTRLYLDLRLPISPGDQLTGQFRFMQTVEHGEEITHHRGQGTFLLAYLQGGCAVTSKSWVEPQFYPAIWRQQIRQIIDSAFPEDTAGFAKALLLGDRTGLDYKTETDFQISGISHIIAVSGLHISILFGLIYFLTGRNRFLTVLIGVPAAVLFAAVAGFSPSVTRATLMQILLALSLVLNKEYDGITALAFSALSMLVINPMVITSVSFQLSFACMAGILLFSEPIRLWLMDGKRLGKWKGKTVHWLSSGIAVSLSATVLTTPLVAIWFGTVSLVAAVTNLLTLWVVTVIFYGIMAVCLQGIFASGWAKVLAWLIAWPIRYILAVSAGVASFPLAAVYTCSEYTVAWLVFAYLVIAAMCLLKRKPVAVIGGLITAMLCLSLLLSWLEPYMGSCRMTMLDVGQGQAILLQSRGKTFLVDCGGDYDEDAASVTMRKLRSQGISRLDGVILTHYDRDHAGGLAHLLTNIDTDLLLLPHCADADGVAQKLTAMAPRQTKIVANDLCLSFGDTEIQIFAPVSYNSGNESSMCVLFRTEKCAILITGDAGQTAERILLSKHSLPKVDVLVAGHHGAADATSDALLDAIKPEYALISVGMDNPYGHPHSSVLRRLEAHGCIILRTDLHGTIIFRR